MPGDGKAMGFCIREKNVFLVCTNKMLVPYEALRPMMFVFYDANKWYLHSCLF